MRKRIKGKNTASQCNKAHSQARDKLRERILHDQTPQCNKAHFQARDKLRERIYKNTDQTPQTLRSRILQLAAILLYLHIS